MKPIIKNTILTVLGIAFTVSVVIATNRDFGKMSVENNKPEASVDAFELSVTDYENASLVDKLLAQFQQLNEGKMMSAFLQYTDSVQPSESFNKKMILWKKDHLFYQQLGNIVVMNHPDVFLQIDHDKKMIVVGDPVKSIPEENPLYTSVGALLEGEFYNTSQYINKSGCNISLSNPRHVSLTGVDFSYRCSDSLIQSIQVYKRREIRIDSYAPIVTVAYNNIEFKKFDYPYYMNYELFIKKSGTQWMPQADYKDYDLTILN